MSNNCENETQKCENCNESPAQFYCVECKVNFCPKCCSAGHIQDTVKSHLRVSVEAGFVILALNSKLESVSKLNVELQERSEKAEKEKKEANARAEQIEDELFQVVNGLIKENDELRLLARQTDNKVPENEPEPEEVPEKEQENEKLGFQIPKENIILSCCNGNTQTAITFVEQTLITKIEVLFDSELHPRNTKEFHSRCDGEGPTVTFIHAKKNSVCCVTCASWNSNREPVSDPTAYFVRLSPNPQKFPIKPDQPKHAIDCTSCSPPFGPSFGDAGDRGCDLVTEFRFPSHQYPNGLCGFVNSSFSYSLPENDFLFPTTDGKYYPIDRIVVCKIILWRKNKNKVYVFG